MLLADVVIDIPTKSLDASYKYKVPEDIADSATVGCAVAVSFGRRKVVGFIVGISEGEGIDNIKPIESVMSKSYFDELGAECARFLAKRYIAPLSVCVRLFMPPGVAPKISDIGKEQKKRKRRNVNSSAASLDDVYSVDASPMELTSAQSKALKKVESAYETGNGDVVLIDGVTGSGKTEVYLQAIAHVLSRGRSAIVLVPEISLTPQTVARFRGRFGETVAVLHSRMSNRERQDQWEFIRSGDAKVVVGARSALFAPLQNLGLIVIDEEHETTYKQESAPRYVSRDVAAWMMRKRGGALVLGSATPSIEALWRAHTRKDWDIAEMPDRANGRPMPKIEIIDMASEFRSGIQETFSLRLREAMREELADGHKVVLLLNQRGFAQFLMCHDCGFVPKCTSCSTTLTYHAKGNSLVCHHCGYRVPAPAKCPVCDSPYLKKFGVGTQRVEEELRAFLDAEVGEIPIIRMDADTTSSKGAHRRLLEDFASSQSAVLLGTQMIAKGLDFDEVTLVGVVNADTQLHLPDFRAQERTFDLIEQVAGRAGRGALEGRVMVQTYEADDIAIQAAARYDRDMFLRFELPKRKVLKYPPYVRMANVLFWGKNEEDVSGFARVVNEAMDKRVRELGLVDWEVLPPGPCVFEKIRNDFRWHIIVKCPMGKDISSFLCDIYDGLKPVKGVNIAFDVDPIDLL